MIRDEKSLIVLFSLIVLLLAVMPLLPTMYIEVQAKVATDNIRSTSTNPSTSLILQSSVGMNSNTSDYILHRGIISSERGQPEPLKVQRTVILQHRQDGKDYTGTLTFTASKPVEVLFGHKLYMTLSNIDTKKFGDLL